MDTTAFFTELNEMADFKNFGKPTEAEIIEQDRQTDEVASIIMEAYHAGLYAKDPVSTVDNLVFKLKEAYDESRQDNELVNFRNYTARLDPDFDYDGQRDLERDNNDY